MADRPPFILGTARLIVKHPHSHTDPSEDEIDALMNMVHAGLTAVADQVKERWPHLTREVCL